MNRELAETIGGSVVDVAAIVALAAITILGWADSSLTAAGIAGIAGYSIARRGRAGEGEANG